ncbi:MAG: CvpA family protein [Clostridium sp.]|nr:CvpA family protein [Clostridium sp.]MCM1443945.1 CvpA family protein [Candidatus Amulumruptor caecigallinarius]
MVDICIIIIIIFGALLGFKRGFTKSIVKAVGFIFAVVFAFLFKNGLASFFYDKLPFFNFDGIFKGMTVLNIALYELIAFLSLLAIFMLLVKVLLLVTSIFERILSATIILGIPSKIGGAIVGAIQNYILVFIILYIITLPMFSIEFINESKLKNGILNNTPILSGFAEKTVSVMDEFIEIKDNYNSSTSSDEFNLDTLDLFLKYDVITVESADKLVQKGKIKAENEESLIEILNKYRVNYVSE